MKAQMRSPSTNKSYGLKRVCECWYINRSSIYSRKKRLSSSKSRGVKPLIDDDTLLIAIREDINTSPFKGEGHKKVHARLRRRKDLKVGRNRVLKVMRKNKLLSPHRVFQGPGKLHDGKIVTDKPNILWATDATKIETVEDGNVWFFGVIEHWNGECKGFRVSKEGSRFVAIDALRHAIKSEYGSLEKGVGHGLKLRPDHGSQFCSKAYRNQLKHWGITPSFSLVREPETNGVVERFHRTLKEQVIYGRAFYNVKEVENAVREFIRTYNQEWLLEKLGYLSPLEARHEFEKSNKAA